MSNSQSDAWARSILSILSVRPGTVLILFNLKLSAQEKFQANGLLSELGEQLRKVCHGGVGGSGV